MFATRHHSMGAILSILAVCALTLIVAGPNARAQDTPPDEPTSPSLTLDNHSKGYWKNHSWEGTTLTLLGVTIDEASGKMILWNARGNNFSMLFAQLIAAELNTNGSTALVIPEIEEAKIFLQAVEDEYGDVVLDDGTLNWERPFDTEEQKAEAEALWEALDAFNNLSGSPPFLCETIHSKGYWKNHSWEGTTITILSVTIDETSGKEILRNARARDFSMFFAQLVTAKLNINGSSSAVVPEIDDAEAYLQALEDQYGDVVLDDNTLNWTRPFDSQEQKAEAEPLWEALDDFNNCAADQLVQGFYYQVLRRGPETVEVKAWRGGFFNHAVEMDVDIRFIPREMARLFFLSDERQILGRTKAEFVIDCYRIFLDRDPEPGELNGWLGGIWTRTEVVSIFAASEEFAALMAELFPDQEGDPTRNFVTTMYIGLLDRLADSVGLDYAAGVFDQAHGQGGKNSARALAKQMAREVMVSDEFLGQDPTIGIVIERLYRAFLGRYPNNAESNYWKHLFNTDATTIDQIIEYFGDSEEFSEILAEYFGS